MTLKEKVNIGLKEARVLRGKNKGKLKANCPPINTYGAAVWQGIVWHTNPFKIGIGHQLLMSEGKREVYNYVVKCGEHIKFSTFE